MTDILKSCTRALGAGGAALLLAGAALAQAGTAAGAAAETTDNQIVVRDAVTGALRAATPNEARKLTEGRVATDARVRLNTEQRAHFSGARGARLSDAFMNHSVIARLPDGSLVEQCLHTEEEAAIAHKVVSIMKPPAPLPTE